MLNDTLDKYFRRNNTWTDADRAAFRGDNPSIFNNGIIAFQCRIEQGRTTATSPTGHDLVTEVLQVNIPVPFATAARKLLDGALHAA